MFVNFVRTLILTFRSRKKLAKNARDIPRVLSGAMVSELVHVNRNLWNCAVVSSTQVIPYLPRATNRSACHQVIQVTVSIMVAHPLCCCSRKPRLHVAYKIFKRNLSKVFANDARQPTQHPCRPRRSGVQMKHNKTILAVSLREAFAVRVRRCCIVKESCGIDVSWHFTKLVIKPLLPLHRNFSRLKDIMRIAIGATRDLLIRAACFTEISHIRRPFIHVDALVIPAQTLLTTTALNPNQPYPPHRLHILRKCMNLAKKKPFFLLTSMGGNPACLANQTRASSQYQLQAHLLLR